MKRLIAMAAVLLVGGVLFAGSKFEIPPPSAVDGDGLVESSMHLVDNLQLSFGNTKAAPDVWFDNNGTAFCFTSTDVDAAGTNGDIFCYTLTGNVIQFTAAIDSLTLIYDSAGSLCLGGPCDAAGTTGNVTFGGALTTFDNQTQLDGNMTTSSGISIKSASAYGAITPREANQTNQTMAISTGNTSHYILITDHEDSVTNYAIPNQSNPTTAMASSDATDTDEVMYRTYAGSISRTSAAAENNHNVFFGTGTQTNAGNYASGNSTLGSGATTTDGVTGDVILDVGIAGAGIADSGSILGNINGVTRFQVCGADGSVEAFDASSNGAYWREFHIPASKIEPVAAGATPTVINTATFVYLLNADTEYLYFGTDIHDDWDGVSDVIVEVQVALSGAETADDVIQAEIVAEYVGEHEDIDTGIKTQTRSINHDIDALATQGDMHHLVFVLDHDLASHVIQVDDNLSLRFRLDVAGGAGNVAAVWFKGANIKYRTSKPQLETGGTFPSEG